MVFTTVCLTIFSVFPLALWRNTRKLAIPILALFCIKLIVFQDLILEDDTLCHDGYQGQFAMNLVYNGYLTQTLNGWNPFLGAGQPFSIMSNYIFWVPAFLLSRLILFLQVDISPLQFGNLMIFFLFAQFCNGCVLLFHTLFNNWGLSFFGGVSVILGGIFFESMYQSSQLMLVFFIPYLLFFLIHSIKKRGPASLIFFSLFLGGTFNHYNPIYLVVVFIVFAITIALPLSKFLFWIKNIFLYRHYLPVIYVALLLITFSPGLFSFFETGDFVSPTRGYTLGGAIKSSEHGFQPGVTAHFKDYTILFDRNFTPDNIVPGHHGFYIGGLLFMFIPFTLISIRSNNVLRGLVITSLALIFLSKGSELSLWNWMVDNLPLFNRVRHSFYLAHWVSLFCLILGIWGLHILLEKKFLERTKYLLVALTTTFLFLVENLLGPSTEQVLISGIGLITISIYLIHNSKIKALKYLIISALIIFQAVDLGMRSEEESKKLCHLPDYSFQPMHYPHQWEAACLHCKSLLPLDFWPVFDKKIIWSNPNDDHMLFMQKDFAKFFLNYVRPFGYLFGNTFHLVPNSYSWKTLPDNFKLNGPQSNYYLEPEKPDVSIPVQEMHLGLDLTVEGKVTPLPSNNPNQITVRTQAEKPMFLLRLENYHNGWTARVDKKEVPITRVEPNFQMVPVPTGSHEISFEFHSPYALLTNISTIATCLGWFVMMYWLKKGARPRWNVLSELRETMHFRLYSATALIGSMMILWLPLPPILQTVKPQYKIDRVPWQASGHLKGFPAQNAFDGDPNSLWHSPRPENTYGHLIRYFESPKIIKGAFIKIRPDMTLQAPSSFLVWGSENGLAWEKLAIKNNISWMGENTIISGNTQLFTFAGLNKPYRFYKFDFLESVGGGFVSIAELRLLENYNEKNITRYNVLEEVLPKNIDRIVVKTGYSSGHYSSFSAGKALDGNPNTFWHSPKPAGKLGWIAGQLQAPTKATHISLTIRKDMVAQAPLAFALSGSMDGINWKTIGIASQLQWVPEESKTFKINNSKKAYSYYKIIFLSTPDNAFVSIVEAGLWSSLPIGR